MMYRTDLAVEAIGALESKGGGYSLREESHGSCKVTAIEIFTPEAATRLKKPVGKYCTLHLPSFSDTPDINGTGALLTAKLLRSMLPETGTVLVIGLGNRALTADALGPKTADRVLATRHIQKELGRVAGLEQLRPVCVCSPGVLGMTGMDTREILSAMVAQIQPAAVIAIDALAAADRERLGCTVQITDSGIAPGSGVGNSRPCINRDTLGIPVIGVGVPTVMDASALAASGQGRGAASRSSVPLTITVREIDLLINRAASLLSMAINKALNPQVEERWFRELTE